eukprot:6440847-Prymnesium_polylepis.1
MRLDVVAAAVNATTNTIGNFTEEQVSRFGNIWPANKPEGEAGRGVAAAPPPRLPSPPSTAAGRNVQPQGES